MINQSLESFLGKRVIVLDGAMGTSLQSLGLPPGVLPETWNLEQPEKVVSVHRSYLEAGAQVIETNTFGANRKKLGQFGLADQVAAFNRRGVELARQAIADSGKRAWVAGVIGPLGELLEPYGPLSISEAYAAFSEQAQALVEAGADLILVQTMSDLAEARQAVLAAKRLGVPVFASVTFEESGKTLTGATPEAAVISLAAAGAKVVGANCSLGPREMRPVISKMAVLGLVPVLAEPNAGLPRLEGTQTVFPEGAAEFAQGMAELVRAGAAVIGGCCGTTSEHISRIAFLGGQRPNLSPRPKGRLFLASRTSHTVIGSGQPVRLIGERINPTGRKKLAADIASGSFKAVASEAREQTRAGAELLDVNVGVAGINQVQSMEQAVKVVARASQLPLVLDSATPEVLAAGAAVYQGKALLNSVSAKKASLDQVLPIAKEHGAAVLGLTLTEEGIPKTALGRLKAAETIVEAAIRHSLDPGDIIIDCLTLTVGAEPEGARETLEAIRLVKEELGVPTVLGVSNISHGLPRRELINRAFLAMAIASGLDAGILNPFELSIIETIHAGNLLTGRDQGARFYLFQYGDTEAGSEGRDQTGRDRAPSSETLYQAIVSGDRDKVEPALRELVAKADLHPLTIIQEILTPALEEVGRRYEDGRYFLPNLLLSAEAAQLAFSILREELASSNQTYLGKALLATVEGDIHDIGKNIVKVILENHGFQTVDLGKDVPVQTVVQRAQEDKADIVLLSALMTTTLPAMEETVKQLKKVLPQVPVMVGGAVVTRSYAEKIGAAGYAKDAVGAVQEAKKLIKTRRS
ncbi:MAG: homocysteine S-methyltransferase family protein [Firmicutes bacterium]|nr:homocysteine S-methyltransferase family protein [Bacillota bacterium]